MDLGLSSARRSFPRRAVLERFPSAVRCGALSCSGRRARGAPRPRRGGGSRTSFPVHTFSSGVGFFVPGGRSFHEARRRRRALGRVERVLSHLRQLARRPFHGLSPTSSRRRPRPPRRPAETRVMVHAHRSRRAWRPRAATALPGSESGSRQAPSRVGFPTPSRTPTTRGPRTPSPRSGGASRRGEPREWRCSVAAGASSSGPVSSSRSALRTCA
jgi:hypothetical protein